MPLGKLSKRQIQSAYSLLTDVQQVSNQLPLQEGTRWICDITTNSALCQLLDQISYIFVLIYRTISVILFVIGCDRKFVWGPHPGSLQSLLHPDTSRLRDEETPAAQQPGLHSSKNNKNSIPRFDSLLLDKWIEQHLHASLFRIKFRCWTTCWTLKWHTACWEGGPRTMRAIPSTSTTRNSKPRLRWAAV